MNQHTKGEWKVIDFKDTLDLFEQGHFQIVGNNQKENVAILPAHWDNAKANAHLIAAAPDLYETCLIGLGVVATLDQNVGWVKKITEKMLQTLAKVDNPPTL